MKQCTKCRELKPHSEFGPNKLTKSGLQSWCKKCHNAQTGEKRRTDPETRNRRKAWLNSDEQREKQRVRKAQPHVKEKRRLARNLKRLNNPSLRKAERVFYKLRNAGSCPKWSRLVDTELFYVAADEIGWEVDHIIPLNAKNVCGLHVPSNLQLLSRYMNLAKGAHFDIDTGVVVSGIIPVKIRINY